MKASYLSNADILKYIDSLTLRTLFVRMKILNKEERVLKTIEGCATGGSISINASSSVRRTGSITLVTGDSSYEKDEELKTLYKVTEIDNLISMNKRVEIEVGLKNTGLEYQEYDTFWIPLGQFLITNASVTHNTQGIQIQVKLTDKMALLNGEIGGTIPGAIIHSPYEDLVTGEKYQALFFTLIRELVSEIGEIPDNKIIIEDIGERIATNAFWKNISSEEKLELVSYIDPTTQTIVYEIKQEGKDYSGLDAVSYGESECIGVLNTDFVFPGKELSSSGGDSVASMLDKIAKELGNFEYFFDLDGNFRFRQIRNYLNEGSEIDDITVAIAEGYFINTSAGKSLYSFEEGVNLINSYANNPVYSNIKNDYTVWGKKRNSENAIRYHLIIDNKKLFDKEKEQLFQGKDSFDVWLATIDDIVQAFPTERAARNSVLTSLGINPNQSDETKTISTFGRWTFNETIVPDVTSVFAIEQGTQGIVSKQMKFSLQTDNTESFIAMKSYIDTNGDIILQYNQFKNGSYDWITVYQNGWTDDKYQTITFGETSIQLLQSFYNWLIANAKWQEKFITSGLWSFNTNLDFSITLPKKSWNGEFCLYNIDSNSSINEIYKGLDITTGNTVKFQEPSGNWVTVYQNGIWAKDKYKYIFFQSDYHIDDDNYAWLIKNALESKVLQSGVKWQFNNIIDLTNFPKENIELKFGLFETISGTKNPYLNYRYDKIWVEEEQNQQILKAHNSHEGNQSDANEVMYQNSTWQQRNPRQLENPLEYFQHIYILESQVVSKIFYDWFVQNAKQYTTPYTSIAGKWQLLKDDSFSYPQGHYDFNVVNRSEKVEYPISFDILEEVEYHWGVSKSIHKGQSFIISTGYNTEFQQKYGPTLSVKYSPSYNLSATYESSWLGKMGSRSYNWKTSWKYIDFGIEQNVSIYFYNWFTSNFEQVVENTQDQEELISTYNMRQTTEYIKTGEVWKLKDNPWLYNESLVTSGFGLVNINGLALFYDIVQEKVLDNLNVITQILVENKDNGRLAFNTKTIYESNTWKVASPIAIKFLQPITDTDFFNYWNAVAERYSSIQTIPVAVQQSIAKSQFDLFDWRLQKYYYYVMTLDTSYLGKEIKENIPKIMNVRTGDWRSQNGADQEYYIDMIDLDDVIATDDATKIGTVDNTTGKKYVSRNGYKALETAYQFAVHKAQRRPKVINSQEVNCLFRTGYRKNRSQIDWANSVFVLNQNDPSLSINDIKNAESLTEEANRNGQSQVIVSKEVFDRISILDEETPAYDLLRSQLHEFLSYNENINLSTVPVYHLDVNTRITVEDEKSDIHGDYIIQSIQIPLTINGQMTINAKRAIERI